jgi:hypothetical protein
LQDAAGELGLEAVDGLVFPKVAAEILAKSGGG